MSKVALTNGRAIRYGTCRMQQRTLQQLAIGEAATIAGYVRGDRSLRDRFLSLGLTRGTAVTIVRSAPTGCPVEVRVRGASLVLRRSEAAGLLVGPARELEAR